MKDHEHQVHTSSETRGASAQEQTADKQPSDKQTVNKGWRLSGSDRRLLFFGSAVILALILFTIAFMGSFVSFANAVMDVISPLVIGCVIAYLCNPIFNFYEYRVFGRMAKGNVRRGLSLSLTVVTAFLIVTLVAYMMIPELIASIKQLIANSDTYINSFLSRVQNVLNRFSINVDISDVEKLQEALSTLFGSVDDMVQDVLSFISRGDTLESVWDAFIAVFNAFKNVIIGLFIAFYLLGSKEKRVAQVRKLRAAVLTEKQDEKLSEFVELTDRCFGGFIFGKILDSLVIGILTFILMTIFEVSEYNLLISTFVGITNVIPVFGPFIGAIPSAFIVLISNPSKFFLFILLILIIQQLDGNIIGPKILGDNTGVSSLCVIIAICTCGTIWGIPGMIIGVPVFAVIIEWIKRLIESRLAAKNKPTDTLAYYPKNAAINAEQDLYYEHSVLLYQYEHSSLKPRFEHMKSKVFRKLGRQDAPDHSAESPKSESHDSDVGEN